ncbi:MAG TPA: hypothetical protein VJ981_07775 [Gammaproteobacteria bacterium]|nr:hypothetical protein [Gammaproteobacteria bacterium]
MVYFRYFSLIASLLLVLFMTACATQPASSPARVEDRSRPVDKTEAAGAAAEIPAAVEKETESTAKTTLPAPAVSDDDLSRPGGQADAGRSYQTGPAVVALLDDAKQYSGQGQNQHAIASVERALRIEPKNPILWNKLSHLHLQQGNWVQSIAMAKKSNVLASGDNALQADNWQIIARARQQLGDKAGASQASEKAHQLTH